MHRLQQTVLAIRNSPTPVIAAVEGGSAGAGASIAFSCDFLICTEDEYISVAYVKVGLTPDGVATAFLSDMLARQLVSEMCLIGDKITAQRLYQAGAVNRLCAPRTTLEHACEISAKLARSPIRATALSKNFVNNLSRTH